MNYTAEIIAVGTELLLGNVANTDAQMISEALSTVGVNVLYHTAVGDNAQRLAEVTEIARKRTDLLIFTGGLGPTYDDFTKDVVCRTFGKKLVFFPDAAQTIQHYYDTVFCRPMPEGTLQQAWLPKGCTFFRNDAGTAPGCVFEADGTTVVLLPGVPSECTYMTQHRLLPWLRSRSAQVICSRDIRIFGLGEPKVQDLLSEVMDEAVNPSLAPYAKTLGSCFGGRFSGGGSFLLFGFHSVPLLCQLLCVNSSRMSQIRSAQSKITSLRRATDICSRRFWSASSAFTVSYSAWAVQSLSSSSTAPPRSESTLAFFSW